MSHSVYSVSEVVGSSTESIDDAVKGAISRAAQTLHNLDWFEVAEIRRRIDDDATCHFQVRVKVGFRVLGFMVVLRLLLLWWFGGGPCGGLCPAPTSRVTAEADPRPLCSVSRGVARVAVGACCEGRADGRHEHLGADRPPERAAPGMAAAAPPAGGSAGSHAPGRH